MTEEMELYHAGAARREDRANDPANDPANEEPAGDGLARLTHRLEETGIAYRVVDADALTPQGREEAYHSLAVRPSVRRRYRVRRVFGTNKYPGSFFGAAVPALVVFEDGRPVDVYPHEQQDGTIVTIEDYLDRIEGAAGGAGAVRAAGGADGAALARRMDALRARIGRVSVSARDLIEDGRRR